ncbi:MAG: hypothetical protein K1X75_00490 [Leptospirales bacterium]|nr:hypothetical protein [Leptospirales bacterium]
MEHERPSLESMAIAAMDFEELPCKRRDLFVSLAVYAAAATYGGGLGPARGAAR